MLPKRIIFSFESLLIPLLNISIPWEHMYWRIVVFLWHWTISPEHLWIQTWVMEALKGRIWKIINPKSCFKGVFVKVSKILSNSCQPICKLWEVPFSVTWSNMKIAWLALRSKTKVKYWNDCHLESILVHLLAVMWKETAFLEIQRFIVVPNLDNFLWFWISKFQN